MPDRLNLDSDRILAGVVAFGNLLDERAHLICRHTLRLDPTHLAAMDSMVALRLVDGGYGIFGIALTVSIAQIEMITVIKTIANGPMVIGHGLNQIVLAFKLLKREHSVRMLHHLHLYP